ncbi:MAG: uroporphyrinogen decarboxylase family protein [Candidatus Hodarchaeales archaeon]|jgi:uroporphyrinogen decarboxylase
MSIDKFDLIKEAFHGSGFAENVPLSIWKHFPNDDRTPEGLAAKELEFQKRFDPDLKKICFHGRYCCVDFGCKVYYDGALSGSTNCKEHAINALADWESLEPVDVNDGEFGKQVKAVERLNKDLEDIVPMMATVFSPIMVADKLTDELTSQLRQSPEIIGESLTILERVMTEFSRACLDAGAQGIFYASQQVSRGEDKRALTDEEFNRFSLQPDTALLRKIRNRAEFIVMHLHGHNIRFQEVAEAYPVDGINWHDQQTFPSLDEARELFSGTLLGGIDENDSLRKESGEKIEEKQQKTLSAFGQGKLVVAPGCVIPQDVPDENIEAVVNAIRKFH